MFSSRSTCFRRVTQSFSYANLTAKNKKNKLKGLHTQTQNVGALRLAVLPCITLCIGYGYMVVFRIRVLSP